jgi:hypothetical protein
MQRRGHRGAGGRTVATADNPRTKSGASRACPAHHVCRSRRATSVARAVVGHRAELPTARCRGRHRRSGVGSSHNERRW